MAQRISIENSLNGNSANENTHSNVPGNVEDEETVNTTFNKKKRSSPRIANLISLFDIGHSKKNKKQNEEKRQDPDPIKGNENVSHHLEQRSSSSSRFRLLSFGKSIPRQDAIDCSEQVTNSYRKIKNCPKKHTLDGFQHVSTTLEPEDTIESISQPIENTMCKNKRLSPLPEYESINTALVNSSPQQIEEISSSENTTKPQNESSLEDGSNNNNNNTQWVGFSKRFTEQDSLIKELYLKMLKCESKTDTLLEENKALSQELREVKRELQCVKSTITLSLDESTNSNVLKGQVSESTANDKSNNLQGFHRKSLTFDIIPNPYDDELQAHKKMIRKADSQDC